LEKPQLTSWATREVLRLYLHACNQETDEQVRQACKEGSGTATPTLLKAMVDGDVSIEFCWNKTFAPLFMMIRLLCGLVHIERGPKQRQCTFYITTFSCSNNSPKNTEMKRRRAENVAGFLLFLWPL
jgi:hypothetical protein